MKNKSQVLDYLCTLQGLWVHADSHFSIVWYRLSERVQSWPCPTGLESDSAQARQEFSAKSSTRTQLLNYEGHFLGNHTVIDVLRQSGYEVEHTPPGQPFQKLKTGISPSSQDTSATVTYSDEVPSSPLVPFEYEDDMLPPHLLLPDSISQLEEFGRQKKWHKKHHKHHRQRQFNDLWVRLEDSTTPLPSHIRITNGYITADYPVWVSNRLNPRPRMDQPGRHRPKSGSPPSYATPLLPSCICLAATLTVASLLRPC